MGHHHRGDAELNEKFVDLTAHLGPQRCVEVGKRLVEQQDRRPRRHRPGQRHPLLLAARQCPGHAVAKAGEPNHGQGLIDATAAI